MNKFEGKKIWVGEDAVLRKHAYKILRESDATRDSGYPKYASCFAVVNGVIRIGRSLDKSKFDDLKYEEFFLEIEEIDERFQRINGELFIYNSYLGDIDINAEGIHLPGGCGREGVTAKIEDVTCGNCKRTNKYRNLIKKHKIATADNWFFDTLRNKLGLKKVELPESQSLPLLAVQH